MEQEKNKIGLNILLVVIIVILLALVILLATRTIKFGNSTKNNDETDIQPVTDNIKIYSYKELAGLYSYTESFSSQDGENLSEKFDLLLNADGTYFYSDAVRVSLRHTGNYIIEDNTIIINKIYSVSDGPSLSPSFETINMSIDEYGQITYNTQINYGNNGTKEISLVKQNESEKNNFINKYGADKEKLLK